MNSEKSTLRASNRNILINYNDHIITANYMVLDGITTLWSTKQK
jgi:hypothetical protein